MRAPSPSLLRALWAAALTQPRCSARTAARSRIHLPPALHQPSTRCRALSTSSRLSTPPPSPSPPHAAKSSAPKTHDRGPASTEDTQTDFNAMDIFSTSGVSTPATAIDACTTDGFHLNNGVKTTGGAGILLFGGEAFNWRPWATAGSDAKISSLLSPLGTLEISASSLGLLDLLYPKPDLLIVGTGSRLWMLGKEANEYLTKMGVRVSVMDTGNASAAYNLLATERGLEGVGAALLPVGWKGRLR